MKLLSVFAFAISLCFTNNINAQTKAKPKPAAKVVKTTNAGAVTVLKNQTDSASYALGVNIAQSLNTDLGDLNTKLITQGLQDVFNKKTPLLNEETVYAVLSTYSAKAKQASAQKSIKEGEAFLQKNKTNPAIKTTTSGLQYEVIKEGTGKKPTATDSVTVHYRGTLIDGTQFDASYDRNEPLTIMLGNVITGWTEGVQLMSVGSKYKFYIPYQLGYGLRGAPPTIPGGSVLIFEVELLEVRPTLFK